MDINQFSNHDQRLDHQLSTITDDTAVVGRVVGFGSGFGNQIQIDWLILNKHIIESES